MELLSPAGNLEKLRVALAYGADAVYIGGNAFNLRAQSKNCSLRELSEAVQDAHVNNRVVYLTMNAFVHQNEIASLRTYLEEICAIPFDGFIVADPAVFSILREMIPDASVHVSTQANVTSAAAARFWQDLGARRIILSRELTLDEIRSIRDETTIELECFVHGAVCMSYSGRCLLSNYLSGRDANRGDCAQPCRWEYRVLEERTRSGEYLPIIEGDEYTTILSAKDLNMSRHIYLLKEAGISSCKIEGRMKSVYYVANVTRVYRRLIDAAEASTSESEYQDRIASMGEWLLELEELSRRESDTGFYFHNDNGDRGADSTHHSYKRGRRLMGMVLDVNEDGYARVRVYNTINEGMELQFIGSEYRLRTDSSFSLHMRMDMGLRRVSSIRNVDEEAYLLSHMPLSAYDIITASDERLTEGRGR